MHSRVLQDLTVVVSKKFMFAISLTNESYHSMESRTYLVNSIVLYHEQQASRTGPVLLIQPANQASTSAAPMLAMTPSQKNDT
jgi:hypothetical protein